MTVKDLEKEFDKSLKEFSEQVRSNYPEGSKTAATEGDICELGRQAFYVLNEFKKSLIKYIESN